MSYFGEILKKSHKNIGQDNANEPGKIEDPKQASFKAKSSQDGAELAQSLDMSQGSKNEWKWGSKVEFSKKFDAEHNVKLTSKNKEHEVEWNFKPADLNKDG